MKRLRFLLILVSFPFLWICPSDLVAQEQPNFLFIIGDDIGTEDIGCYGHPTIRTPVIDGLAQQGAVFTHAFLTASSCSPSRCSMITGRYPHNTGAPELHMPLPDSQVPFPRLLKDAGYYTAQAGKWHLGQNPGALNAFDSRSDSSPSGCEKWVSTLRERDKEKPFFMWFAAHDAHRGWDKKELIGDAYRPDEAVVPPYLADDLPTRQDLADYYNEITRFDHYIGLVLDELKQQQVLANTVIFILSDNGRPFPRCKTRVYDSGMQTPLVVYWPDGMKQTGKMRHGLVSSIDIAPTILELAGIAIPECVQGRSFAKMLIDPEHKIRDYVFSEHNWHDYEAHERQVRTEQYMYVRNARPQLANQGPADSVRSPSFQSLLKLRDSGKLREAQQDIFEVPRAAEELFDVQEDPQQLRNLAGDPEYQSVLHQLRAIMDDWQQQTGDTVPEEISSDRFDRRTGKVLQPNQWQRKSAPGTETRATDINLPGPIVKSTNRSLVQTWPAPKKAPRSEDFTVNVHGQSVDLYAATNRWGATTSFGYFDFEGTVEVELICNFAPSHATSFQILPAKYGIQPKEHKNGRILFDLDRPAKLTFVILGDWTGRTLHLFANAPEKDPPRPDDEHVIYFGPGYHEIGKDQNQTIRMQSNQTLYLAPGAYVVGFVHADKAENLTLKGRGILAQFPDMPRIRGIYMTDCKNITIDGFIMNRHRDGWCGNLIRCDGIRVTDYKVVSPAIWSTDGLNLINSRNVRYDDCFFRCGDDNIAIKGFGMRTRNSTTEPPDDGPPNENILITDCTFWSDNNNAVVLGQETVADHYKNITFRDCDILFVRDEESIKAAMALICLQGTLYSDITFEDIRVGPGPTGQLITMFFTEDIFGIPGNQNWPGSMENITFKDITAVGPGSKTIRIHGWGPDKQIRNVTFDNVTVNGNKIKPDSKYLDTNPNVKDLKFNN